MSEEFLSCKCSIFKNVCCCPPKHGVQILQPWCQIIEDKCGCVSKVDNPFYWHKVKKSYFTYKVCVDCECGGKPAPVSFIAIPVCKKIDTCSIEVDEKIDESCNFCRLCDCRDYYFDEVFGGAQAPEGFKWLIIKNDGRYGNGICVLYRLTIDGKYEATGQVIRVRSGDRFIDFNCGIADGCFKVPSCPRRAKIHVTKECSRVGANVEFTIGVANKGDSETTINLLDKITIPENLTVQFTDFGGCMATFQGSGMPVALNTNVTNTVINIRCNGITIPEDQTIQRIIKLRIIGVGEFNTPRCIVNVIPKDGVTTAEGQIPESNLPVSAKVCISANLVCNNPCADSTIQSSKPIAVKSVQSSSPRTVKMVEKSNSYDNTRIHYNNPCDRL